MTLSVLRKTQITADIPQKRVKVYIGQGSGIYATMKLKDETKRAKKLHTPKAVA